MCELMEYAKEVFFPIFVEPGIKSWKKEYQIHEKYSQL